MTLLYIAGALWLPFCLFGLPRLVQNRWLWLSCDATQRIQKAGLLAAIPLALALPLLLPAR
jgi:hypothetical protein